MGRKARIDEIQVLRGLAFLAVVLQHTIGHYDYQPDLTLSDGVMLTIFLLAVKFAVPMFIFITGLVLFYNYDGELQYFDFVRKRIKDIIVPYLFWTLVYVLYFHEWGGGVRNTLYQLYHVVFTGKASYHLWYVVMIFQFYLLFPLFRALLRSASRAFTSPRAVIAGTAVLGALYLLLSAQVGRMMQVMEPLHIPVLTPLFTTYADRNFLYFFFYFVLGALAGLAIDRWREWVVRYRALMITLFLLMCGDFLYIICSLMETMPTYKLNLNNTYLIQPRMGLLLIASIPVAYLFAMHLRAKAGKRTTAILESVGNYSYGAYLAHALLLDYGIRFADALLPGANVTWRTLLAFALCSIFAVLLTYLISFLPFGKWLGGVKRTKKVRATTAG